jgi:hypothetical protein|tara:strand:+ start:139 stop:615 length:477 start_codon:yes stop_codon:yes gene_type:complete
LNLRETFVWNLLIGASALTILYYLYLEYNNYNEYNIAWNDYSKEESGTDKELLSKINDLETKLKQKDEYKFTFKENNPTDLRRIIELEGMESYFGVSSNDIKVFAKVGNRAIVQYNGKPYKVALGDTIAGGKITILNDDELVFLRDGEEKRYSLKRKK